MEGPLRPSVFSSVALLMGLLLICIQCRDDDHARAKKIVTSQCGSCHVLPEPQSLTQDVWQKNILPQMSFYYQWEGQSTYPYANQSFYRKKAALPMNDRTWALIESYYLDNSPVELVEREESAQQVQTRFEEITLTNICGMPSITAMLIDEDETLYCACNQALVSISSLSHVDTILVTKSVISDIVRQNPEELLLLNIGELGPHDIAKGSLNVFDEQTGTEKPLLSQLYRPVEINHIDSSYYISEYGNLKGRFSSVNQETFDRSTLIELPGSYRNYRFDIDQDGADETLIQFSQSLEGVYVMQESAGEIDYERIISFPPEYGFSDLDTADMNRDGYVDLIITNGDNADFSPIDKPYHGLRIYLNDGAGHFEESYFYPMYGATQLKVNDYNGDGYQDVIVSSFFPRDISKSIVLLEQSAEQPMSFDDTYMEHGQTGRWLVMEDGDIDHDGDVDLVLSSFVAGPTNQKPSVLKAWLDESVDVLVLKNRHVR